MSRVSTLFLGWHDLIGVFYFISFSFVVFVRCQLHWLSRVMCYSVVLSWGTKKACIGQNLFQWSFLTNELWHFIGKNAMQKQQICIFRTVLNHMVEFISERYFTFPTFPWIIKTKWEQGFIAVKRNCRIAKLTELLSRSNLNQIPGRSCRAVASLTSTHILLWQLTTDIWIIQS